MNDQRTREKDSSEARCVGMEAKGLETPNVSTTTTDNATTTTTDVLPTVLPTYQPTALVNRHTTTTSAPMMGSEPMGNNLPAEPIRLTLADWARVASEEVTYNANGTANVFAAGVREAIGLRKLSDYDVRSMIGCVAILVPRLPLGKEG